MTPLNLPEPDETRLANSPLELAVCQLRFENHPEVADGDFAAEFHGALGGETARYPKIDAAEEISLRTDGWPRYSSQIWRRAPSVEWRMASADGAWIVTLRPDHVALETRRLHDMGQ